MSPCVGSIAFTFNLVARSVASGLLAVLVNLEPPGLCHKVFHDAMENFVRIPSRLNQADKVTNCFGGFVFKQLHDDIALSRFEFYARKRIFEGFRLTDDQFVEDLSRRDREPLRFRGDLKVLRIDSDFDKSITCLEYFGVARILGVVEQDAH